MKPMISGSIWTLATAEDRRSPILFPRKEREEAGWQCPLPTGTAEDAYIQAGIEAREKLKQLRREARKRHNNNNNNNTNNTNNIQVIA